MSENLRDHTLAWLDSIGADGLMPGNMSIGKTIEDIWSMAEIKTMDMFIPDAVSAYRHADGTYHTEKEIGEEPEQIVVEE